MENTGQNEQKSTCSWRGTQRPRVLGKELIQNPAFNKGLAFTLEERQILGIHGLLPPAVLTQDQQVSLVMDNFYSWKSDLNRYIYLMSLLSRNEKLFYRVVTSYTEAVMPIIYTPTVGLACLRYGFIHRQARGLFITTYDRGHVRDVLANWPVNDVTAIVVTDGERILGLGDLGAFGMGIPIGKLILYSALGGVNPRQCLPILLDVGTNCENIREDPLYLGIPQQRERKDSYEAFVDEFMEAVVDRYGQSTLIQFEDFAFENAFDFLNRYRDKYCMFNDDIQGTAAVALAAILCSIRVTGIPLAENVFLFQGAGQASCGIAGLLVHAMVKAGLSEQTAIDRIWMLDNNGLLVKTRCNMAISQYNQRYAKDHPLCDSLSKVVDSISPTVLIGVSAAPNTFTPEILTKMAAINKRPIIFPLSNPTSKAECTAEQAFTHTKGMCIFASGSPFPPVTLGSQTFHPAQCNNSYIFPGVALAIVTCLIRHVPDDIFLVAAQALSETVTKSEISQGQVIPPLSRVRDVSLSIATGVAEYAFRHNLARLYPVPSDIRAYIASRRYTTDYDQVIPTLYSWPKVKCD